ncbi:helix-turn-helix transcriptional regulator [Actinomycetospora aeridis]|uniref:AAA family ATPase n=1 Tax=Actinomycetospora aeridis TaxID=3129231 RepID=A0ABU8N0R0_9PSEU
MAEALVRRGSDGVGRAAELARLLELVDRARVGTPPPVLIIGPPGIGKSELVDRLRARVAGEMAVVRAVAPDVGVSRPGALLERCLAAARAADGAAGPTPQDDAPPPDVSALLTSLDALDDHRPVLLVVDDLQRADPESLASLRRLVRRLHPLRVLAVLVGHDRPDDWLEPPPGDDWPEDTVRMTLPGLTVDDVADLAREVDPDVTPWTARRLHEETDGNPMYLRAVLADTDLAGRYRLGRPRPPGSLAGTLRRRLARLADAPREALEALAVMGGPTPVRVLRALTGRDTVAEDCAPLVREGLLEAQVDETDEILAYRSALVRDAVYGSVPAARRRALHRRAADHTVGAARWRHLVGSTDGPDAALADDLARAAAEEFARGGLVAAAEYLLWAAARSTDEDVRAEHLTEGVRLLVHASREGHALQHAAEIEALPDSPGRSELLGLLAFARDEVTAARDLLITARAGLDGDDPPETIARLDLELAFVHCQLGAGGPAQAAALDARGQVPAGHRLVAVADAFLAAGTAFTDGPAAALEHLAFLPAAPAQATPYELAAVTYRGVLRGLLGRLEPACADLTVVARRRHTPLAHLLGVSAQVHLIWCDYLLGEWDAARRELEGAVEAVTRHGRSVDHAALWSLSAILHAGRGELDAAGTDLRRATDLAAPADFLGPRVHLTLARAAIAQAEGRAGDVVGALGSLTPEVLEPDRARLYAGWWLPSLAESQLDTGHLEDAARTLTALERVASAGACLPVARAWLGGRLAAELGDLAGARRALEAGLALPADGGEPGWYRTRLRHTYGAVLLRAGERAAGRAALYAAADVYSRLGARPFLERCLADLDGPPDAVDVAVAVQQRWADGLTDREREVTTLVGRGWTNPEIAAELFVSTKTVEYHLRNVYGKLGLRSRRALRDRVQRA